MMFKDLHRLIQKQQQDSTRKELFTRLQNKPFWIWDRAQHMQMYHVAHGKCCFNHIIGLPQKDGNDKPMYDYEQLIFDQLSSSNNKHIWIKKATGLGVSEFMLRFMAWVCLKDSALAGSQMCIVTGPRIELAIALIERMKGLFKDKSLIVFNTKETVIELNGVKIEAFPSHHLDAMRGLSNVSFILLDEADFFPPGQQQDARDVSERYIAKSNPYIVMVSTPHAPEGLFERMEKEPVETCLYKRLFLDYTYGMSKIYTAEEIERAKQSPSFEREYNLKYLGQIGNIFHSQNIDAAITKGKLYDPDDEKTYGYAFTSKSMGLDPGYGSSAFGVVVTQWTDDHIQILYADEFARPDYSEMVETVYSLMSKYQVDKTYVDASSPSFIKSLKLRIGEKADYLEEIDRLKKEGFGDGTKNMNIVPVGFGKEHKSLLGHCKMILEQDPCKIAINPKFEKLVVALRTAVENDGTLDKEATSHDDIFDAFRLALKSYNFREV
jgi:hypothetical protein